jgi:hypothetical protein
MFILVLHHRLVNRSQVKVQVKILDTETEPSPSLLISIEPGKDNRVIQGDSIVSGFTRSEQIEVILQDFDSLMIIGGQVGQIVFDGPERLRNRKIVNHRYLLLSKKFNAMLFDQAVNVLHVTVGLVAAKSEDADKSDDAQNVNNGILIHEIPPEEW